MTEQSNFPFLADLQIEHNSMAIHTFIL